MAWLRNKRGIIADITSIGGAAFDIFIRAPHTTRAEKNGATMIQFPLGAKIKVESVMQSCGGGAANTSVGFSRLGLCARFCGIIGDDEWGQGIQKVLKKEGVLTDAAVIVEGEISSFSAILVDAASGQRTVLYSPNVNEHMCDPVFAKDILHRSRWLFLNHLSDVSCVILDDCLDLVRPQANSGKSQLRFAWNPGGSQIREGYDAPVVADLLWETDILFLNAEEAMDFMRSSTIKEALKRGVDAGVKIMCVTDGARGAYLTDGRIILFVAAVPDVRVVDTTGAGDAFAVGVTWGLVQELDLQTVLKVGMLNAASVIGRIGTQAGLLTDTEIRKRLAAVTLDVSISSLS